MKVAVLGAGAIGAYVGAALHRADADVHLVARGPQLAVADITAVPVPTLRTVHAISDLLASRTVAGRNGSSRESRTRGRVRRV